MIGSRLSHAVGTKNIYSPLRMAPAACGEVPLSGPAAITEATSLRPSVRVGSGSGASLATVIAAVRPPRSRDLRRQLPPVRADRRRGSVDPYELDCVYHSGVYGMLQQGCSLLLIRKARGPYEGLWDLPGGTPEIGETSRQTLVREVAEETGVVVQRAEWAVDLSFTHSYGPPTMRKLIRHTASLWRIRAYDLAGLHDDDRVREDAAGASWRCLGATGYQDFSPLVRHACEALRLEPRAIP